MPRLRACFRLKRITRWIAPIERVIGKPWGLPLAALLGLLDIFIGIIPTNSILVAVVFLHPAKWLRAVFWFALAGALGAGLLATLVGSVGFELANSLYPGALQSPYW